MHKLTASACLTLVAAVHSQGSFVVPSANKTRKGNAFDAYTFNRNQLALPVRMQLVYSTSDIPTLVAVIQGIHFRCENEHGLPNPAATATLSLDMSVGPNTAASASSTFAANLGLITTVFNGKVNLPAASGGGGPGPAPFVLQIQFTTPFPYLQVFGQGLVADLRVTTYISAGGSWLLDSQGLEAGTRTDNGELRSTCRFSNGSYNNALTAPGYLYLTSTWFVAYRNLLPNAPGVGVLGNVGVGQYWGSSLLPIDLGALGAPGCRWNTNIVFALGLQADALGTATWPSITIPNDPALGNTVFHDQALFLDPAANAAGIVTAWSSKWNIGTGALPEGSQIVSMTDSPPSSTGSLYRQAVIAQFVY